MTSTLWCLSYLWKFFGVSKFNVISKSGADVNVLSCSSDYMQSLNW
jgi:hypothetical protein